jgi:hypothetical protein
MSDRPADADYDHRLRAYLLGELPVAEREEIETKIFEDEETYDRLLEAQYDLIDAYARDALTSHERVEVEQRLLGPPEGQRRTRLARALARREPQRAGALESAAVRDRGALPGWLAAAAAALAVAALSAAAWFGLDNVRLRRELAAAQSRREPAPPAVQAASHDAAASALVADVVLSPGVVRSDRRSPSITIPREARLVRAQLEVEENGSTFTVGVERLGEGRIWTQSGLERSEEGAVVVWLPPELLEAGEYEWLLWRGTEDPAALIASYVSRIERR